MLAKALKKRQLIRINQYHLFEATAKDPEIFKSIINYCNYCGIVLNIKVKTGGNISLLMNAIIRNNPGFVDLLLEYADKKEILLDINEKMDRGAYPLLDAADRSHLIVEAIIKYANKHNIILNINDSDNKYKRYPLLNAVEVNSEKSAVSLVDYAVKHDIKLNLNEKFKGSNLLIYTAVIKNNSILVKLLLFYANKINCVLELDENDIKSFIKSHNEDLNSPFYKNFIDVNNDPRHKGIFSFSEIDSEIIKFLKEYKEKNIINIKFCKNSELLKRFNNIKE